MAEDSFQEKTEKATPRRREKAREKGQVARSMDLNAAGIILLGFTSLFILGPQMVSQTKELMRYSMAHAPTIALQDSTMYKAFGDYMLMFLKIVGPIFAAMVIVGFGVNVVQVGFRITTKQLEPKFEKLDVIKGLKRFFEMKALVQLVRDPLKLAIVALVAYFVVKSEFSQFFLLPDMSVTQFAQKLGLLILTIALKIGAAILVIAILDFFYQRYEFEKSIRMTKQEIKDEYKDTDGNPLIKSRARQVQREMARRRMMDAVPTADVVVTNPTHLAVALKYDAGRMDAPMVVAKGERLIAQRIKDIAIDHGIPIYEDKPLARSLFKMCDVGDFVPASLYKAVAEVLAYIYRLKKKAVHQA